MKRTRKKLHPIGRAIEDVLGAGHTPRLQIDSRRKDVVVPAHVRTKWGPRLIIDLDPSWPLALEHTPEALEVDLAFQGLIERCKLGWGAIYALVDRATGQGTVFRENLPLEELPAELRWDEAPARPDSTPPRLSLASVRTAATGGDDAPRNTEELSRPVRPREPEPVLETSPGTVGAVEPPTRPTSDEEAKARRARFRVIAGGG